MRRAKQNHDALRALCPHIKPRSQNTPPPFFSCGVFIARSAETHPTSALWTCGPGNMKWCTSRLSFLCDHRYLTPPPPTHTQRFALVGHTVTVHTTGQQGKQSSAPLVFLTPPIRAAFTALWCQGHDSLDFYTFPMNGTDQ